MKTGIPGTIKTFSNRTGGYINYQYNAQNPEKNNPIFVLEQKEANLMLEEANSFIEKHFPQMRDFVIFQFKDGTIRLDIADAKFLSED